MSVLSIESPKFESCVHAATMIVLLVHRLKQIEHVCRIIWSAKVPAVLERVTIELYSVKLRKGSMSFASSGVRIFSSLL